MGGVGVIVILVWEGVTATRDNSASYALATP